MNYSTLAHLPGCFFVGGSLKCWVLLLGMGNTKGEFDNPVSSPFEGWELLNVMGDPLKVRNEGLRRVAGHRNHYS